MKRPTGRSSKTSQESTELGEKAIRNEQESTVATDMEQEEGVEWDDLEVDDVDELGGGERSKGLPGALGEKKRRLAQEQVCALERSFESDNKLDPVRKARIARDVGLQPRQVAVWFQNSRARWKTKQLERDFAALRASHDALYLECDALRRDKDILSAKIRELKEKANRSRTVAKLEAMDLATEERPITVTAAVAVFKDGFTDSDSSIVFNDVEASPYSSTAFDQQQPCLIGLGSFAGISGTSTSSLWELIKGGGLMEDGLLGSADELSSAGFLADEHVSSLPWYGPGGSE